MPLRKTAIVDIGMFDVYLESVARMEDKISRLELGGYKNAKREKKQ